MRLLSDLRILWRQRYWRMAIIAAAAVALVVLALGGFRRAPSLGSKGRPPESPVGVRVETGAFAITPLCAWTTDLRPGQPASMRGQGRFLILRARVENLGDDWLAMSAYVVKDLVWLAKSRDTRRPLEEERLPERMQRADDQTLAPDLQPRLPVIVDFVWDVQRDDVLAAEAAWGVLARRYVEKSYKTGGEEWEPAGPAYRLSIGLAPSCAGVPA